MAKGRQIGIPPLSGALAGIQNWAQRNTTSQGNTIPWARAQRRPMAVVASSRTTSQRPQQFGGNLLSASRSLALQVGLRQGLNQALHMLGPLYARSVYAPAMTMPPPVESGTKAPCVTT